MLHHTQLPQSFHAALTILAPAFFSYVKYASEASLLVLTSWFVPHSLHYEHLTLISLIRVQNKFTQKLFQPAGPAYAISRHLGHSKYWLFTVNTSAFFSFFF